MRCDIKKYIISLLGLFFFFWIIWLLKDDNYVDYKVNRVNNNLLTMNLEQTAGKGDYKEVKDSSWPSEDYVFNSKLSRCENGGELSWDDAKKQVIFESSQSDKCYVYFDKLILLVNYVINQYSGVQGENGLYHHDGTLENGIDDGSYRYAGANPNNFVCFGSNASTCPDDNLYRIIGVIGNSVKLIKAYFANTNLLGTDGAYGNDGIFESNNTGYKGNLSEIDKYNWNSDTNTNVWSESNLNTINLNTNYINNIGDVWANKINTKEWYVGGNSYANIVLQKPATSYENEILFPVGFATYYAKIGLMYVSDYAFATNSDQWSDTLYMMRLSSSWLYMGVDEWTITPSTDTTDFMFIIYHDSLVEQYGYLDVIAVRPVFFLNYEVNYVSGTGTQLDPIRIK